MNTQIFYNSIQLLCEDDVDMMLVVIKQTPQFIVSDLYVTIEARAIHRSGRVGFKPDLDSTQLDRVTKSVTRNRPAIWVRPDGSGHRLNGLDFSGRWVWASNWAKFMNLDDFFLTHL